MSAELLTLGGRPEPLGATLIRDGVNFAVYSETASAIFVCLFDEEDREIGRFELDGHEGNVHFGLIIGIGEGTRYGLRADGPYQPDRALLFDPNRLLLDPYARRIDRPFAYSPKFNLPREAEFDTAPLLPKAIITGTTDKLLSPRRKGPGLIYELNVRGFTQRHPDVDPPLRGTLAALTAPQVLEHLLRLGVDAVELMPIMAAMDERHLPPLGLTNAWGYNPVGYFVPDPRLAPNGVADLRALTEAYRKAGVSVILDVVYNHTAESDAQGAIVSLRGLDARAYYRHVELDGRQVLVNDTGTGNTLRCDHPAVQKLVIDSLRFWVGEGGVSGFRFDLATVLGREPGFNPDARMLQMIRTDPVLSKSLLIAEPWDIGPSGYQLGRFGREFREWNDTFRDEVRSFWRGDEWRLGALASKVSGSAEIFDQLNRKPSHGVNFLATHDGFTLLDLVSYTEKHNEANGENNRDGHAHNLSWNCGVEGATTDPGILAARRRDVRALLATVFFSRGLPMLAQGDEMGRTQGGNNNAYAQDNEITWLDWEGADRDLIEYTAAAVAFRRAHPVLSQDSFLSGQERGGIRDVVWLHPEGREMGRDDWNQANGAVLGMLLSSPEERVLVWFNRRQEPVVARSPVDGWVLGFVSDPTQPVHLMGATVILPPRSVVALVQGSVAKAQAPV